MRLNASASTLTSSTRPLEISMRGARSPASTRVATCAIRRSGADTRAPARYEAISARHQHDDPGERKRPGHPVLRAMDERERFSTADDHLDRAEVQALLEDAHAPDVGEGGIRVSEVRHRKPASPGILPEPLALGLPHCRRSKAEDLGMVADRTEAGNQHEEQRRVRGVGLREHVAGGRVADCRRRLAVQGLQRLMELDGVAGNVAVDLAPELRAGVLVDDQEHDRGRYQHHGGDPGGQSPSQPGRDSQLEPSPRRTQSRPGRTLSRSHRTRARTTSARRFPGAVLSCLHRGDSRPT